MRFSVLLPTRNGGDYLENCIRSILEQDYGDFELVISDNANVDSTPEVIDRFAEEPRMRVIRQRDVIPVPDNWTAALQASRGDYVLMMGDDDYLLPGTLRRLDETLLKHGEPDCVLFNGYSFVAPNAISGNQCSYWASEHHRYESDFGLEGELEQTHRLDIVSDMFRFRQRIPLNMQTTLFARRVIERECGGVFVAPFPDHYLLNALLITADKWVYLPERLVVVGVSPKSFGHYFYSQTPDAGLAYLGICTKFQGALPGSELLNGTYAWLLALKARYPVALKDIDIDHAGYVRRQVYAWFLQYRYRGISAKKLLSRFAKLSFKDWEYLLSMVFWGDSWRRLGRLLFFRKKSQAEILWRGLQPLENISNIREFSFWLKEQNTAG